MAPLAWTNKAQWSSEMTETSFEFEDQYTPEGILEIWYLICNISEVPAHICNTCHMTSARLVSLPLHMVLGGGTKSVLLGFVLILVWWSLLFHF